MVQCQGLFVVGFGRIELAGRSRNLPQVVIAQQRARVALNQRQQHRRGFFKALLLGVQGAQIQVGLLVVGLPLEDGLVDCRGLVFLTRRRQQTGQEHLRLKILGLLFDHDPTVLQGLFGFSHPHIQLGQAKAEQGRIGVELDRAGQAAQRRIVIAPRLGHAAGEKVGQGALLGAQDNWTTGDGGYRRSEDGSNGRTGWGRSGAAGCAGRQQAEKKNGEAGRALPAGAARTWPEGITDGKSRSISTARRPAAQLALSAGGL